MKFLGKIRRKFTELRLQPIRVFCFHHVSDVYDPITMWKCDWVNTDVLIRWIIDNQKRGYTFVSLPEAQEKLKTDIIRRKKYAVLTADDGFRTLLNIVPWLIQHQIPITLFVNPKYILKDGIGENVQDLINETHGIVINSEMYLRKEDIEALESPYVTFAYHGYEHLDELKLDEVAFTQNVILCEKSMESIFPHVIPFYAHTYGRTKRGNDAILSMHGLIPVYISGMKNYDNASRIDRELISNERII